MGIVLLRLIVAMALAGEEQSGALLLGAEGKLIAKLRSVLTLEMEY